MSAIIPRQPIYAAGRNRQQAVQKLSAASWSMLDARGQVHLGLRLSHYKVSVDGLIVQIEAPCFIETGLYSQQKYFQEWKADPASVPFHLKIRDSKQVLHIRQIGAVIGIVWFQRGSWEKTLLDAAHEVDREAESWGTTLPAVSTSRH